MEKEKEEELQHYSRKQEFLKDNMKSLLGLLNQVMTTNQQQEQFQKIKSQIENEDLPIVEKSPKKIVNLFFIKKIYKNFNRRQD